MGTGM
jgi:hypothetical protein